MFSHVEQMRAKYKKRRKEAGSREDSTMAKLAAFTSTLRMTKKRVEGTPKEEVCRVLRTTLGWALLSDLSLKKLDFLRLWEGRWPRGTGRRRIKVRMVKVSWMENL